MPNWEAVISHFLKDVTSAKLLALGWPSPNTQIFASDTSGLVFIVAESFSLRLPTSLCFHGFQESQVYSVKLLIPGWLVLICLLRYSS